MAVPRFVTFNEGFHASNLDDINAYANNHFVSNIARIMRLSRNVSRRFRSWKKSALQISAAHQVNESLATYPCIVPLLATIHREPENVGHFQRKLPSTECSRMPE